MKKPRTLLKSTSIWIAVAGIALGILMVRDGGEMREIGILLIAGGLEAMGLRNAIRKIGAK